MLLKVKNGTVEISAKFAGIFTDRQGRFISRFISVEAGDDENTFVLINNEQPHGLLNTAITKAVVTLDDSPF